MRRTLILCVLLIGCGGVPAVASSEPWSSPVQSEGEPLPCPVASSRAGRPERVLALPGGRTTWLDAKGLVDTDGSKVTHTPLPSKDQVWKRSLACAKDGTIAVAWVEDVEQRTRADRSSRCGAPARRSARR